LHGGPQLSGAGQAVWESGVAGGVRKRKAKSEKRKAKREKRKDLTQRALREERRER
jgi:hypothetical protein